MMKTLPLALIAVATIAGCTAQVAQDRADLLGQPIDCATAAEDIAALAGVIPDRGERLSSGVRLILPASLVVGAARGQLGERSDVASGRSEDAIRTRIADIDAACDNVEVTFEAEDAA
ncbi:MAG: hypothetical protein AAFP13_11590 [Pseudomonadota bacterium]